jgi:acyl-CoA synthetase (AMP-forming)/AMP-acid ligase II
MHPALIAMRAPDRPAFVMGRTGEQLTYRELDQRANQLAHLFRDRGIRRGGHVAVFLQNHIRYAEIVWAAHISGVRLTPVNSHLTAPEVAYIVNDCGAELVIASAELAAVAGELTPLLDPRVATRLMVGGTRDGWGSFEDAVRDRPVGPIADPSRGGFMFYSSGTTGRPKGIVKPLNPAPLDTEPSDDLGPMARLWGLTGEDDVFLVPGPLYFSAATNYTVAMQSAGATVVVMERFDAAEVLRLIARYRVTAAQFVPTHFIRMLALPDEVRAAADTSSMRLALHAGAPCPPDVKRAMIGWWGPVITEYYAATEGICQTWITAPEWLERPGSVGRPVFGILHVLDVDGTELPPGKIGEVWVESPASIEYHGDPDKTAAARNDRGYHSVGDVGYVDEDGYLFLTDRLSFMIISGGVNIYPQEVEARLIAHPKVADVAVFGIPNDEFGEEVKAVVEPKDWADAGSALAEELEQFCRAQLAGYKCPRSFDFESTLPRLETGKLAKAQLRDRYRRAAQG